MLVRGIETYFVKHLSRVYFLFEIMFYMINGILNCNKTLFSSNLQNVSKFVRISGIVVLFLYILFLYLIVFYWGLCFLLLLFFILP